MSSIPNPVPRLQRPPTGALPSDVRQTTEQVREALHQHLRKTASFIKFMDALVSVFLWIAALLLVWSIACAVDHWLWPLPTWGRWLFWGVGAAASAWCLFGKLGPLLLQRINPVYAAQRIEHLVPEFKNGLISWLELESLPENGVPRGVMSALAHRAARFIGGQEPSSTVDTSPLIKMIGSVLLLSTGLVLYTMLAPKSVFLTGQRILFPWSALAAPTRVQILDVQPGALELTQGKPLQLQVVVKGLRRDEPVAVRYSTLDGQLRDLRNALTATTEGYRYAGQVTTDSQGVQQPLDYWIEAGDAASGPYRVAISPLPSVVLQAVELTYPAYTQLEPRIVKGDKVEAIEGTRARIHGQSNQPLTRGRLEINPSLDEKGELVRAEAFIDMEIDQRNLYAPLTLLLDASGSNPTKVEYRIRGYNQRGDANPRPVTHAVNVLADMPPEVTLIGPESRLLRVRANSRINLEIRASDPDFGLSRLSLIPSRNGVTAPDIVLLENEGIRGRQVKTYSIDLSKTRAAVGERFEVVAVAADNRHDPISQQLAPNITRSQPLVLQIIPEDQAPDVPPAPADEPPSAPQADPAAEANSNLAPDDNSQAAPSPTAPQNQKSDPSDGSGKSDQTGKSDGSDSADSSDGSDSAGKSDEPSDSGQGNSSAGAGKNADNTQETQSGGQGSSAAGGGSASSASKDEQNPNGSSQSGASGAGSQNSSGKSGSSASNSSGNSASNTSSKSGAGAGTAQGQPSSDREAIERVSEYLKSQPNSAEAGGSPENNAASAQPGSSAAQSADSPQASNSSDSSPEKNSPPAGSPAENAAANSSPADNPSDPGSDSKSTQPNGSPRSDSPQADPNGGSPSPNPDTSKQADKPGQSTPSQAANNPSQSNASQSQPDQNPQGSSPSPTGDAQSGDSKAGDSKAGDSKAGDSKAGDSKAGDSKAGDSKAGDSKAGDSKAGDSKAGGSKAGDSKAGESQSPSNGQQQPGTASSDSQSSAASGSKAESPPQDGANSQEGKPQSAESPQQSPAADSASGTSGEDAPSGASGAQDSQPQPTPPSSTSSSETPTQENPQSQGSQSQGSESKGSESKGSESKGSESKGSESKGSESKGSESKGSESKGSASQSAPDSGPSASGSGRGSAATPAGGTGSGVRGGEGGGAGQRDASNSDFADQTTNMVLDYLNRQKDQPDPELLRELNWTPQDLQRFVERWNTARDLSRSADPAQRKQWQEMLEELNLSPASRELRQGSGRNDSFQQMRDSGGRLRAPASLQKQFEAYRKAMEQAR